MSESAELRVVRLTALTGPFSLGQVNRQRYLRVIKEDSVVYFDTQRCWWQILAWQAEESMHGYRLRHQDCSLPEVVCILLFSKRPGIDGLLAIFERNPC